VLTVTARTRCIGFHRWPAAPEHRAYLRDRHRHEFHIAATVLAGHGDRAVEFHDLAADLARHVWSLAERTLLPDAYDFGERSCEALAEGLAALLQDQGQQPLVVTVSEDGQHDGTWWAIRDAKPPASLWEPAVTRPGGTR
jgi:hypothetical protein